MKKTVAKILICAILAVLVAGCGDDDPVAPSGKAPGPLAQFAVDLNSDVVVNNGLGALDSNQESVDDSTQGFPTNYAYVTQSVAEAAYPTDPDGLPDDGFFPENGDHPDVQLAYRNNDNGHNARRIMSNGESYTFATGTENFSEIHLFMAAGQGNVSIQLTLNYDNVTATRNASVPDWFNEVPPTGNTYYLIDGMDRMKRNGGQFENRDDAAIFGINVPVDSTYALESITIRRNDTNSQNAVLVLFGAVGVRAKGYAPPTR